MLVNIAANRYGFLKEFEKQVQQFILKVSAAYTLFS